MYTSKETGVVNAANGHRFRLEHDDDGACLLHLSPVLVSTILCSSSRHDLPPPCVPHENTRPRQPKMPVNTEAIAPTIALKNRALYMLVLSTRRKRERERVGVYGHEVEKADEGIADGFYSLSMSMRLFIRNGDDYRKRRERWLSRRLPLCFVLVLSGLELGFLCEPFRRY